MGRKGGIKSGIARRKKRELQKYARWALEYMDNLEPGSVALENLDKLVKKLL